MERLPLSVNKSNLLRLEEELSFARGGLEFLDEKKEALMARIHTLAIKADRVRARLNDALEDSYRQLREALLIHGRLDCERAALACSLGEQVEIRERSFMGVALPRVKIKLGRFMPSYGFHGTGIAMDSIARIIYQSMEVVAELAEIEVGLFRLVVEIKKTVKRINALENIYIPLYEKTIKYIEENLEEKEREFLFQLKRCRGSREEQPYGGL